jgi:hypothetical protein
MRRRNPGSVWFPSVVFPSFLPCLAILLASVALIGCATPGPLVSLALAQGAVVWVAGRAVVAKEQTGVRVAAAFEHQDGVTLGLRVEIENTTEAPLEVDPANITFNVCTNGRLETCSPPAYAINPEAVLKDLALAKSRNEAETANEEIFLGTLAVVSAVGDVATVASGKTHGTTGLQTAAALDQMGQVAARRDSTQASIGGQQQLWADVALRRNTIPPGRAVGGRVFLPISLKARRVWLHVLVGGRTFSFPFDQTVTTVDLNGSPSTGRVM